VTAAYGDKLITLSTCEYTRQGNRLVVVAKRIEQAN
jgi:sortase B